MRTAYEKHGIGEELREALRRLKELCTREDGQDARDWEGLLQREMQGYFEEAVDQQIELKAREVGMEWTAELLTATFALPDGRRVRWGEATLEQHRVREGQLAKNAARNLEAATRHRVAIHALEKSGARCLNEVA